MRVLIVEADGDVLEVFSEVLRLDGFDAVGVTDPWRATELLDAIRPDAVVVDLPDDDASEFRRAQRGNDRWAAVPVIVVTAAAPEEVETLHPARVLARPFSVADVERALREVVPERHATPHQG